MRSKLFLGWIVILFVILNAITLQKEAVLSSATQMLLELAPVDPRSLMQGDYMALDYAMSRSIDDELIDSAPWKGKLVIRLNSKNVAQFLRFHDGKKLQEDEKLLSYRKRGQRRRGKIKIATDSFFFQEGTGKKLESARYGEFKLSKSGECILVGLRSSDFKSLLSKDVPLKN